MNILILGTNGQVGQEFRSLSTGHDLIFATRSDIDLSNLDLIDKALSNFNFDCLINCAAYTAVDKAESEEELANLINHLAVKKIGEYCSENDKQFIHISTDFIFNGHGFKPVSEDDTTNPLSVYGATKLKGENALKEVLPKSYIIRTSWVYSSFGSNFVKSMIQLMTNREELGIIFDQVGTPTYARDLAEAILTIIDHENFQDNHGVYHYSNEGVASWYDFAKAIQDNKKIECTIRPIETFEYPTPAKRPSYCVMNKSKIKSTFDLKINHWRTSLDNCMKLL